MLGVCVYLQPMPYLLPSCSFSFVDIVRFNLLTSDWYDPDHRESLLAENNRQRASATFNNLRLSCNVAGNCKLQVTLGIATMTHAP